MATIAQQLSKFILETPFEILSPELVSRAQAYVLDTCGASLVGVDEPSSQIIVRTVLAEGGPSQATILGKGRVAPMGGAALANGAIAHAQELDDDHRLGTVHPGAVIIPAALACVEALGWDGKTFLRAVVMGYEVACRAGEAFLGRQYYGGFHPTSTCGVFGAAVAAGVVLELNHDEMVRAMGIAGTQAFGLGEWRADGSWIKRLHPGRAAQSGILASRLAKEGFTGPATIFEGDDGFLKAFSHEGVFDAGALIRDLGDDYRGLLTAYKPYPGCRFAHAAIDLGLDMLNEDGIRFQDIENGRMRIYKTDILNYTPRPSTSVIAQFSVPYLLAAALVRGKVTLDQLTEKEIHDPEILAVADRIQVIEDPKFTEAYPERYSTELTLTLKSGKQLTGFRDCPRGDPEAAEYQEDPGLLDAEIERKFRMLLESTPFASRIDTIIETVRNLPEMDNIENLTALIGSPPP
jgi:2-methylcitrate dehydratase PrpD